MAHHLHGSSASHDAGPLPTRHRVLLLLDHPRCAREVRERLPGATRKGVETALRRLADAGLVICVTPEVRQSRLYGRTPLGDLLARDLSGPASGLDRIPLLEPTELRVYAWIQAGLYRRHVLRAMAWPMKARQIRRAVIDGHARIGMNHVHAVLREFRARSIADRDHDHLWALTVRGLRFRQVDGVGLPKANAPPVPMWVSLDALTAERAPPREPSRAGEN